MFLLNGILPPYASLTEEADDFRGCRSVEGRKFSRFMRRVVAGCKDVTCAVETLNREAWSYTTPPIKFASGTGSGLNAYSLYEVIERKNSSCTGLSIFLVSALRAVGVPARIVGTPHWNLGPDKCPHGDADDACGNHDWVEAFIPDLPYRGWVMVDQANAKSPLNASWFSPIPAIYQIDEMLQRDENYFVGIGNKPTPFGHFPLVWDWGNTAVRAWDVSESYQNRGDPRGCELTKCQFLSVFEHSYAGRYSAESGPDTLKMNIRPASWQLSRQAELQQKLKHGCDPAEIARSHLGVMSVSNINLAMNKLRAQRSRDVDVLIELGGKLLEFETAKWGRPSHILVSGRVISDAVYALTKLIGDVPQHDRRRQIAKLVLDHAVRVRVEAVKISTGDAACILWSLSRIKPFLAGSEEEQDIEACWAELCSYLGRGDIAKRLRPAEVALLCSAISSPHSSGITTAQMGAVWQHAIAPKLDDQFTARNVVEVAAALASLFPEERLQARPKWAADAGKALAVFTKINLTYFTGQGLSRMLHALVRMQALDSVLTPKAIAVVCNNPDLYDARATCGIAYAIAKSGYHSSGLCLKACERVLVANSADAQSLTKLIWASDVVGAKVPEELWQLASVVARTSERLTATMAAYVTKGAGYPMVDLGPAIRRGTAQDLSLALWSASVTGYVLEDAIFFDAVDRVMSLRPLDSQSLNTARHPGVVGRETLLTEWLIDQIKDCQDVLTYDPHSWPLDHETDLRIQRKFYSKVCNGVLSHLIELGVFQKIKDLDATLAEKVFVGSPAAPTVIPPADEEALQREVKLAVLREKIQEMEDAAKERRQREQEIDGRLHAVEAEMAALNGKADSIAAKARVN
ncbi:hypothetical protein FOL46_002530 [Perkinsus olseni]|uniref:Transglutaminase-like domain-containing protein n=1 Tax=Perkinsus olseni TaxID=32597 RepID=A0A7J6M7B9_PEROL|nr:hypothetical protein FOL46_002530 [Perkinsus olseni]